MKFQELIGNTYNSLKVIRLHSTGDRTKWECECICGKLVIVDAYKLKTGSTKSCGCQKGKHHTRHSLTHGLSYTALYKVLQGMKTRCYNDKSPSFLRYGARGIHVCSEWLNHPEAFYKWSINNGYENGLQIDRINNNGGYSPENCRWTTSHINQLNKRNTVQVSYKGVTKPLFLLCEDLGKDYYTIYHRIKNLKWNIAKAIELPIRMKVRRK